MRTLALRLGTLLLLSACSGSEHGEQAANGGAAGAAGGGASAGGALGTTGGASTLLGGASAGGALGATGGGANGGGANGGGANGGTPAAGGSLSGGANSSGGRASGGEASGGDANGGRANAGAGGTANGGRVNAGGGGASASGGATAAGGAASGGGSAGGAGCGLVNDEFDASALSGCWTVLNGSAQNPLITLNQNGGQLHLRAMGNQNGVWYQGSTKSLVYQSVTANAFKITTSAHPRKASSADALPTKDLHVGGLMLRNPSSNGGNSENYVFLMVGHSENNNGMVHQGVEFKTTVNGCSNWAEPDWGAAADERDAELRICRIGAAFRLYKRVPGATAWSVAEPPTASCNGNVVSAGVLMRADLPETLQVGVALNFNAPSDLDVAFDYVRYAPLSANATAADCISD